PNSSIRDLQQQNLRPRSISPESMLIETDSHTLPNNDEEIARPSKLGITTGESVDHSQHQSIGQTSASSRQFEWNGNRWDSQEEPTTYFSDNPKEKITEIIDENENLGYQPNMMN
ncbi:7587_t:CDS:2, partial [Dentiscutata heterogama]